MTTPTQGAQRLGEFTDEHVRYVARYGGLCRDCADENGVCPRSGLPCGGSDKAIRRVLEALSYGIKNGYVSNPLALASAQQAEPREVQPLTDEAIKAGRQKTFSTNNPFCPCDAKTMRKAVRWAERACATAWGVKLAKQTKEPPHGN